MSKFSKKNLSNIVYSTNKDFVPESSEDEDFVGNSGSKKQDLRVWLEKNARGGKQVSIVRGFKGSKDQLNELGKEIKRKCGVGGTVKDGEIIIQGDQRDKILLLLKDLGYNAKKAGS